MPNTAEHVALCVHTLNRDRDPELHRLLLAVIRAAEDDRIFARAALRYIAAARNARTCAQTAGRLETARRLEAWTQAYECERAEDCGGTAQADLVSTIGLRLRDERLRPNGGSAPMYCVLRGMLDAARRDDVNALRVLIPDFRALVGEVHDADAPPYEYLRDEVAAYLHTRASSAVTGTPCTLLDPEALYAAIGDAHGIARHSAQGLVCGMNSAPPRHAARAVAGLPELTREAFTAPEGVPLSALLSDLCARGLLAPGVYIIGTLE